MFLLSLLQAVFGTSIPIGKKLLEFTSPVYLTGIRMFLAGIFLVGYSCIYQKQYFNIKRAHVWSCLQIMVFGIYLKYILRYWGLRHLTSAKMAFLLNATPFVAAFFSYIFFKEKLTKKKWAGLCVGFLGFMPILLLTSPSEHLVGQLFFFSWAELAILAGVASHCYGLIIARRLITDENYSATMINGIRTLGGGILALISAFFLEGFCVISHPAEFVLWLAALVFISNIICHNLYLYLLKHYSITFLALTDFLSPLFTALWGWIFFHETVSWHFFVSSGVVFLGLYIFYLDELAPKTVEKPKVIVPVSAAPMPSVPLIAKGK